MKNLLVRFASFRVQIILTIVAVILLFGIWISHYLYIGDKTQTLNTLNYQLQKVSNSFSKNVQNFQAFAHMGYKNRVLYEQGTEEHIEKYFRRLNAIKLRVEKIQDTSDLYNIDISKPIDTLSFRLNSLQDLSSKFKDIILIRGFDDYGVEGEMHIITHQLENHSIIDKSMLLELRRHEKDYLMRGGIIYKQRFEMLINTLIDDDELDKNTKELLENYNLNFNKLVNLNLQLGLTNTKGFYADVENAHAEVEKTFLNIIELSKNRILLLQDRLFLWQLIQTFLIALLMIALSFLVSKYSKKDLKSLSLDISNYIKSNFKNHKPTIRKKSNIKEMVTLNNSYNSLKEKLEVNIRQLEETTEKAKKTSELKTQFLTNMSHEIRSPLNGVIGMLNLVKSQDLSAQQLEYMEIAENSADHLMELVDMILDHSKLQTGMFVLNTYSLNLKRELNKLVRLFEYRALDKNVKLKFSFDPAIENNILGDNLRIQQVLINLLDNAIKFTDAGDISLEAELISRKGDIQNVRFKVTDSGIGIDADKAKNILSPFEQVDPTNTRKYGGAGLGLTIAHQIIKIMDGRLNIMNNPKQGSCFYFEVPLKIDKSKALLSEKELNYLKVPTDYNRSKVLIAEDNLINQKVIVNFLKKLNIEADVAKNGLEALSFFKGSEYDLIFMDLHMPVMDGFTSVTEIKKSPKYRENPIPIIAVTASAFDEDKSKSLAHGMHDFITKPVIFNKLQETIFKHMSDEFKKCSSLKLSYCI